MLYTGRIDHKIKTAQEIKNIVRSRPRDSQVVLCHGVFDIVHPGHIRHMLYAKTRAPILVAGVTADVHIKKGPNRPFVPEQLRATNLAALEFVDYVVIDDHAGPEDIINEIQPDFYVKGYEYSNRGTKEAQVVTAYGGEVVYSPGDVVYSSTSLLNLSKPNLWIDKLQLCLDHNKVTFNDLHNTLGTMAGRKVHVIGDLIVDSITHCGMIGGQTKTPTISARLNNRSDFVGGAGVVAKHCHAAGADVKLTTLCGNDEMGRFAFADLKEFGVKVIPIVDNRPTINKNVIEVDGYRVVKVDTLDNSPISNRAFWDIVSSVDTPDAVIFSDFRHGIFNKNTIPILLKSVPSVIFRAADSQVASRWGNISDFQGLDLITPNEREARFSLGDQDSSIRQLALDLRDKANAKCIILKLGELGAIYNTEGNSFALDSFAENAVDPVGAGDALLAYATLAMMSSGNETHAAILGLIAAACECEFEGNIAVTNAQVRSRLDHIENQMI